MASRDSGTTTAAQLRAAEPSSLEDSLREAKQELFNLRFQNATGQLDNTARLRKVRKDIARIYTVMRERELGIIESDAPQATDDTTSEAPEAESVKADAS